MDNIITTNTLCASCGRPILTKVDLYFECTFCGHTLCEACVEIDELIEAAKSISNDNNDEENLNEFVCSNCYAPTIIHNKKLLSA